MDQEWRDILLIQPKFGEHAKLVFEYVEKFGVTPLALKTAKILRLLKEMLALFEQKRFQYQKREYQASPAVIVESLKTTCNKCLPGSLHNHNYLKQVMMSINERDDSKTRNEREKYLRDREHGAAREEEVRGQKSEAGEEKGKTISDWIRESKIAKPMPE